MFEFSLAAYLEVRCSPRFSHLGWEAIPVFLSKAMLAFELCVRRGGGVDSLADLRGKRVGVPDVHMTAAVWLRIMLAELHGVAPADVAWVNGRPPSRRHSQVLRAPDPPGVSVEELAPGESLQSLLEEGGIDAAFGDHAQAAVEESTSVCRLFEGDSAQRTLEKLMQRRRLTPVNHVVVVRGELLDGDAELGTRLMRLFEASKQAAYRGARVDGGAGLRFDDEPVLWRSAVFGEDPYPSGVAANRPMLTALFDQLAAEAQLAESRDLASLFLDV